MQRINLGHNTCIGDEGVGSIARCVVPRTTRGLKGGAAVCSIRWLDLSSCDCGDEGALCFAPALDHFGGKKAPTNRERWAM